MIADLRAETIRFRGAGGDEVEGYLAQPLDEGRYGGVVVIHHLPGYDAATKEITRRFAAEGFLALLPNLYTRQAPGADPDDAAAEVRAQGGISDEQLVGDVEGAAAHLRSLTGSNGRVGVIGFCAGGRQAFLAACTVDLDAAVDCYGAFVVGIPPDSFPLRVRPLDHLAGDLRCPLLGLFGAEDPHPTPEETEELRRVLTEAGKEFDFHTYDGAGHAFFAPDRPSYRPEAAVDGWRRILAFFDRRLAS